MFSVFLLVKTWFSTCVLYAVFCGEKFYLKEDTKADQLFFNFLEVTKTSSKRFQIKSPVYLPFFIFATDFKLKDREVTESEQKCKKMA